MANTELRIAAWAAIISAVLIIPSYLISLVFESYRGMFLFRYSYITILIIGTLVSLLILRGYLILGKKLKLGLLRVMSIILIVGNILMVVFELVVLAIRQSTVTIFISLAVVVTFGIVMIIFGVSVLALRKRFKNLATALGVLYIMDGIMFASVFLVLLYPLVAIPASILEAVLFFRASKKIR
ncbi:hypothetical protein GF351_06115 [Candidatus Woesearchaeota archaeon]|nr:hypothetical protein [Candidatus Woesearchaeota archaeon]